MQSVNEHIHAFLVYYCDIVGSPEYAVLIKGPWGSGKSRFIMDFLNELEGKGKKSLYVSLYGVNSIHDIENQFFSQLHPVLASKGAKMVGKLFKGIIRASIKVDLDGDGSSDGDITISAPNESFLKEMQSPDGRVLVFDDVERCSLPIAVILGYINYFVEHSGLKVILVANEQEILAQNGKADIAASSKTPEKYLSNEYERIKEKLIGKSFEITPETEAALSSFIDQVKSQKAKALVSTCNSKIIGLYHDSGYKNLRVLRHSILEFERMFAALSESIRGADNEAFEVHFLALFLVYSFEISNANLSTSELGQIGGTLSAYMVDHLGSSNGDPTMQRIRGIRSKYNDVDIDDTIFDVSIWAEWFGSGFVKPSTLSDAVLSSKYFRSASQPAWIQLWHAEDLTDIEYIQILDEVKDGWNRRIYTEVGEVKHIVGSLLWLSDAGLYKTTCQDVVVMAKHYVDHLKQTGQLLQSSEESGIFGETTSWRGLAFRSRDKSQFKELLDYIDEKQMEARIESYPSEAAQLLRQMEEDTVSFARALILSNYEENKYYDTPILMFMDPAKFVEAFIQLPQDKKRMVGRAFQERYKFSEFRQKLAPENVFLAQVAELLNQESVERAGTMSAYNIQSFVECCITPAISLLNELGVDNG
jgi:hypothetical protein